MDADGSHDPQELPEMLECLSSNDIVIGSRYVENGLNGDSFFRRQFSRVYNKVCRFLLRISIRDPMSGYIVTRKKVFDSYKFPSDYKFMLPLYATRKLKVVEHPIDFQRRKEGKSKTSFLTGFKTLSFMTKLFYKKNKEEINKFLRVPIMYAGSYVFMYILFWFYTLVFGGSFFKIFLTDPVLGWITAMLVANFVMFRTEMRRRREKYGE